MEEDIEEFIPRKPDYKGDDCVVWHNKKGDTEWLSIKIESLEKTLVAYKNE